MRIFEMCCVSIREQVIFFSKRVSHRQANQGLYMTCLPERWQIIFEQENQRTVILISLCRPWNAATEIVAVIAM